MAGRITTPKTVRRNGGGSALAEQTPAADDEILAAQLDRLERRVQTTRSERGRIADLYQAGVIDNTEMRRRSAEIETRSRRFDQERQALIARQTELATDNRLHHHITGFAQQVLAGIDTLDFEGRQQLMRLVLEDVRVRGWQVELRLRIPLDTNPPASPESDKPKRTRARSPRGSRPAKEAVSSNDRLRSIGQTAQERPARRGRHRLVAQHRLGGARPRDFDVVDAVGVGGDGLSETQDFASRPRRPGRSPRSTSRSANASIPKRSARMAVRTSPALVTACSSSAITANRLGLRDANTRRCPPMRGMWQVW